ncbi:MAG TPA: HD domain-containing phosphohydrolase [Thermaerobacter sp.]
MNLLERATHLWLHLAAYHPPTAAHCQRVALGMLEQAKALGLSQEGRLLAYLAGLLHDVGKLAVPVQVLDKPGRLTEEERAFILRHPLESERLALEAGMPEAVARALRHHHERWDGRGYPDRLSAAAIPWLARGLCAVDALDAMTEHRPYRQPLTREEALRELEKERGRQFDPAWVDALLGRVASAPRRKTAT